MGESEQVNLLPGKGTVKSGRRKKPKKKEESLQIFVSKYIMLRYPGTIFNSDIASGLRLTMGQAIKAKLMRSGRGQPDIVIFEPRANFHGLCLELKNEISDVYLKDGITISDTKSNRHVLEQADMLKRLRDKGYWADFAFGRDDCMKKIDTYFSL